MLKSPRWAWSCHPSLISLVVSVHHVYLLYGATGVAGNTAFPCTPVCTGVWETAAHVTVFTQCWVNSRGFSLKNANKQWRASPSASSTGFSCHEWYLPLSDRFQSFIPDSEHLLQHCPLHHTPRNVDTVYVRPCQDVQLGHVYVRPCQDVLPGYVYVGPCQDVQLGQTRRLSRDKLYVNLHVNPETLHYTCCDISGQSYAVISLVNLTLLTA